MTVRRKRLLVLPLLIALYLVHPMLGIAAVVCGYVSVFFVRRAREGMAPTGPVAA